MNRTPITPPAIARMDNVSRFGLSDSPSADHRKNTGMVKIAPPASDSPAEPMVCTILLSRIDFRRRITRMTTMEITAAGIDADTVMPTLSPR